MILLLLQHFKNCYNKSLNSVKGNLLKHFIRVHSLKKSNHYMPLPELNPELLSFLDGLGVCPPPPPQENFCVVPLYKAFFIIPFWV